MSVMQERVSIELIDAGEHHERVAKVLSKVKGLAMPAEQLVENAPCTIATDVPKQVAEQLQGFLEKAGAMVMLEGEKELAISEELLVVAEESIESDESADEELVFEETEEEFLEPAEEMEPIEETLFSETGGDMPVFLEPDELSEVSAPEASEAAELDLEEIEAEEVSEPAVEFETEPELETSDEAAPELSETKPALSFMQKFPALKSVPVAAGIIAFLVGVVFMGVWGKISQNSIEAQWQQKLLDYEKDTVQKIEQHSAELKNTAAQLLQKTETLGQENTSLKAQIATLTTQLAEARQLKGGQTPETSGPMPSQEELVKTFEELMAVHAQSLENGYDAQKQAGCSQQLLLDGKSTYAYAQVVKQFSSKHAAYDIMTSSSLLTPYIAEFKIPFYQEMRTGNTAEACNAAALQKIPTPEHHEFGGYYGYWTIQYVYKNGKWIVKPTVIERNRALYESAFQKGSPDYAKFLIDTKLFPEFKQ